MTAKLDIVTLKDLILRFQLSASFKEAIVSRLLRINTWAAVSICLGNLMLCCITLVVMLRCIAGITPNKHVGNAWLQVAAAARERADLAEQRLTQRAELSQERQQHMADLTQVTYS